MHLHRDLPIMFLPSPDSHKRLIWTNYRRWSPANHSSTGLPKQFFPGLKYFPTAVFPIQHRKHEACLRGLRPGLYKKGGNSPQLRFPVPIPRVIFHYRQVHRISGFLRPQIFFYLQGRVLKKKTVRMALPINLFSKFVSQSVGPGPAGHRLPFFW